MSDKASNSELSPELNRMLDRILIRVLALYSNESWSFMAEKDGSTAWALDPARARHCEYLVMVWNAHPRKGVWTAAPGHNIGEGPHHHVVFVAKGLSVIPVTPGTAKPRYRIAFTEYAILTDPVPFSWGSQNPVRYLTGSEFPEINFEALDWKPFDRLKFEGSKQAEPQPEQPQEQKSKYTIAELVEMLAK